MKYLWIVLVMTLMGCKSESQHLNVQVAKGQYYKIIANKKTVVWAASATDVKPENLEPCKTQEHRVLIPDQRSLEIHTKGRLIRIIGSQDIQERDGEYMNVEGSGKIEGQGWVMLDDSWSLISKKQNVTTKEQPRQQQSNYMGPGWRNGPRYVPGKGVKILPGWDNIAIPLGN